VSRRFSTRVQPTGPRPPRTLAWKWGLAGLVGVALVPIAVVLSGPHPVDHFRFLNGRTPSEVRVGRVISGPSQGEAVEARTYYLPVDFRSAVEEARGELTALGFKETRKGTDFVEWQGKELLVTLTGTRGSPRSAGTSTPPSGTTVVCGAPLPDGLITELRLVFEEEPER
jgi:hypothetical protein